MASIDVGSNTVRMLLARVEQGRLIPCRHERAITRLGGGFIEGVGLAPQGMERTLAALQHFAGILQEERPTALRVVGTAAIRRAPNRDQFVQRVNEQSGLRLEVIDGQQEARLSALGVLEALHPRPAISLVIDIGGGSTELILLEGAAVRFRQSYQLGVVRLCEEYPRATDRQEAISKMLDRFESDLSCLKLLEKIYNQQCEFVGTAGTVTSLAALDLQM